MLRRSSRIAATYGPVYSNLPSVATQRRAQRAKDVFALARVLKAALRDEGKKLNNPLQFSGEGSIQFVNEWVAQRYVPQPVVGQSYHRICIVASYEGHSGSCNDPEFWRTDRETYFELHFQPFTAAEQRKPLMKSWTENIPGHEECGAVIRYTIHRVERITMEDRTDITSNDSEMSDCSSIDSFVGV